MVYEHMYNYTYVLHNQYIEIYYSTLLVCEWTKWSSCTVWGKQSRKKKARASYPELANYCSRQDGEEKRCNGEDRLKYLMLCIQFVYTRNNEKNTNTFTY